MKDINPWWCTKELSDGTDIYLYGHDRLRALGGPWYIGDALGSVRQTLDDAGGVRATTSYDPWGTPQGTLSAPFGFTGELHHQGQVYLRARWYAPGQGRFVSEDPFAGFPERPYSLHAYQYAYSNPVRWTDPSGNQVNCSEYPNSWPFKWQSLCHRANRNVSKGHRDYMDMIDAREELNQALANTARNSGVLFGPNVYFSVMMNNFLHGGGKDIDIFVVREMQAAWENDRGIARATREWLPAVTNDEPEDLEPLLYIFLRTDLKQAVDDSNSTVVDALIRGKDSSPRPRPHTPGFWAAFGHVTINGMFNARIKDCGSEGYRVKYDAEYTIKDRWEWRPGSKTPVPNPRGGGTFIVPHNWQISLIEEGRAHEFNYTIVWHEDNQILVTTDFSDYRQLAWWERF